MAKKSCYSAFNDDACSSTEIYTFVPLFTPPTSNIEPNATSSYDINYSEKTMTSTCQQRFFKKNLKRSDPTPPFKAKGGYFQDSKGCLYEAKISQNPADSIKNLSEKDYLKGPLTNTNPYHIEYSMKTPLGSTERKVFDFTVKDTTNPTITLIGDNPIEITDYSSHFDSITVIDNYLPKLDKITVNVRFKDTTGRFIAVAGKKLVFSKYINLSSPKSLSAEHSNTYAIPSDAQTITYEAFDISGNRSLIAERNILSAKSCLEILEKNPSATSGEYTIMIGTTPTRVYCDMTTDGGGWTLVMRDTGKDFSYDNNVWTTANTVNPTAPEGSSKYKGEAFNRLPGTEVMIDMGGSNKLVATTTHFSNLQQKFSSNIYSPTLVGKNKWLGLLSGSNLQPNCNKEGFNIRSPHYDHRIETDIRVGIIANQENHCKSSDSRLGMGGRGELCGQDNTISSGNTNRCYGTNVAKTAISSLYIRNTPNTSCKTLLDNDSTLTSGNYKITRNGIKVDVYCDMTTDGGGYTMKTLSASGGNQDTYANACKSLGLEIIVPRTQPHAKSIKDNIGIPNLVNIFPKYNGAWGLSNWEAKCNGSSCSFWISSDNSANVGNWTEPNGNNNTNYRLVRWSHGGDGNISSNLGSWDDQNNNVIFQGTAYCSTNDK